MSPQGASTGEPPTMHVNIPHSRLHSDAPMSELQKKSSDIETWLNRLVDRDEVSRSVLLPHSLSLSLPPVG